MNNIIIIIIFCFVVNNIAQTQTLTLKLSEIANFKPVNRKLNIATENEKTFVHLDAKPGAGIAWINNTTFKTGTIEFDVKGKDVMQQSFVGIAFHGMNDSTYDAVYFRPFNFNSPHTARKNHSVQNIAMPQYDWFLLKQNFPGKYESALTAMVDANSWFHAKIVVSAEAIKVYVNGDNKPSLTIKPLNNYTTDSIGFWVGNNSDGDFSNLVIQNN